MNKNNKKTKLNGHRPWRTLCQLGSAAMVLGVLPAQAFNIDTGNPDLAVRWDNTFKYNLGWRVEGRDSHLVNSPGYDSSTLYRDKGDVVTNRLDILSEMDVIYKADHGFRVSAAGWDDFAYKDDVQYNPALGAAPTYPDSRFSSNVRRYYDRSGELLDAFVFTKVELGSMPLNLRLGRHNVYWGESLFTYADSIAYGQGPLDLRKATSTPGIEAKELFLPQSQLSGSLQVTDDITVAGNYYLEWDPHRLPDGGTYLGSSNVSLLGDQVISGIPYVGDEHSGPNRTPRNTGSWGLSTRIQSDALGGNIGLYVREFDDRMPTILLSPQGVAYNAYARNVRLYGISYNRMLGAISVSAELSRRENTLLNTVGFSPELARGDTWHALVNMMAYVGKTPLFDSAPLSAELTYARLGKVYGATKAYFNHEDYACTLGKKAGCATDDAWGMNLSFTPTWYQVFPSIDLTMPITLGVGLAGNSPAALGPVQNSGSWSVGVEADLYSQYKVGLAYNDYFGDYLKNSTGQIIGTSGNATLSDRGWISLTLKSTF